MLQKNIFLAFFIFSSLTYGLVSQPFGPNPANNAGNVNFGGIIAFQGGLDINVPQETTYKIYLDTNPSPTTFYTDTSLSAIDYLFGNSEVEFYFDSLLENTSYYWKVEVIDSSGNIITTSPIWSFLTKTVLLGNGGTFNGNITFTTQDAIDTFASNLYTTITGNLTIGFGTDINNGNDQVADLSSLENLTAIGGDLTIQRNNRLITLRGLQNISSVGGKLHVHGHPLLENLNGLSSITTVSGELRLIALEIVTDLSGLSNLNIVGTNARISFNPNLTTLSHLSALTTINGVLLIIGNDSLINIGFSELTSIINISIRDNELLPNLVGFENINPINRNIQIENNQNLVSLQGLNFHSSIGSLRIVNNLSLSDLNNLQSVSNVNGNLNILNNDSIIDLSFFNNLTTISNLFSFSISNNQNLTSLSGLDQLTSVGWSIIIADNPVLTNIDALSNLSYIPRALTISNNPSLINIDGLFNVTAINTGFSPPSTIGLNLTQNNSLTNLDGLTNLNILGGNTRIIDNNILLDFCGIQTYVDNYSNVFEVTGNGYNPTQQDIINNNCSTLSVEVFEINQIKIYPNPTTDFIKIETNGFVRRAELFNLQGQKVNTSFSNNKVDVQNIASGVYFLKLQTNKGEVTKKVVKK
jgi:hypothetical protein